MIRTLRRTLGLLLSAASLMALATAQGPSGQPSALERIPVLMDALQARLAAREAGAASAMPAATGPSAAPPSGRAVPFVAPRDATAQVEDGYASPDAGAAAGAPARLPRGTERVKVNRGLP